MFKTGDYTRDSKDCPPALDSPPMRYSILFFLSVDACTPSNPLDEDNDGDGYSPFEGDCDDNDPTTFPGAAELDSTTECMTDAVSYTHLTLPTKA